MIGNFFEATGIAASIYGLQQSSAYHEEEIANARQRHEVIMKKARDQHRKNLMNTKKTYLLELFYSLEQHFQQLNADLISSGRESERDMFDQRSQNLQTIILASSVMFSALSTVIIQGYLPNPRIISSSTTVSPTETPTVNPVEAAPSESPTMEHHKFPSSYPTSFPTIAPTAASANSIIYISYSLFSALSFAFLFLSVVICVEVIRRASLFMYQRAKVHSALLNRALLETKNMMDELHIKTDDESVRKTNEAVSLKTQRLRNRSRVRVSSMTDDQVEEEWLSHESKLRKYLEQREQVNNLSHEEVAAVGGFGGQSFQQFWDYHCTFWSKTALLCFYLGTLTLLVAILIFVWAQFAIGYDNEPAAYIAVVLIGLAVFLGVVLIVLFTVEDKQDFLPVDALNPSVGEDGSNHLQGDADEEDRGDGTNGDSTLTGGQSEPNESDHSAENTRDTRLQRTPTPLSLRHDTIYRPGNTSPGPFLYNYNPVAIGRRPFHGESDHLHLHGPHSENYGS